MIWPTDILSIETWVLIGTFLGLVRYYLHRKWQYFKKLNIPHEPATLLGAGHLVDSFKTRPFTIDLENKKKFGNIFGVYIGVIPIIVVYDLEMLRKIFVKEFPTFPNRQPERFKMNGILNEALTEAEGQQWKRIRSSMTPTFSTSKLKQMLGIMHWCVDNTLEVLKRKNEKGDGTFNPKEVFSRLSLDIICSAAFSTKVHSQDDTKEEPEIIKKAKALFNRPVFSPMLMIVILFPSLAKFLGRFGVTFVKKSILDYFENLTNFIIKSRGEKNTQEHVDLMQLMLNSEISEQEAKDEPERGMTRKEIVANSMLMILAGYENTANSMSYLAFNLACHPDIQSELQKEIDEMMKTHGKFDYEGVNSLKFLDMCFNESLRLYMPILRNARAAKKDITINGFTIPAGANIGIPCYALSHDPEYWDEPSEFKPERMKDMSQIDPMVFQPFGAGPRNCIGMRFAVIEIKLVIAKILHEFSLRPAENTPKPPLELVIGGSLRPKVDFNLRAVPRNVEAGKE